MEINTLDILKNLELILWKYAVIGFGNLRWMAGVWMWQMKWIGDFGEIFVGLLMRKIRRVL